MPERIQRRRTKGWRMPEGAVYVGRPTRWGNPIPTAGPWIEAVCAAYGYDTAVGWRQAMAVAAYRSWLMIGPESHAPIIPAMGWTIGREQLEFTEGTVGGAAVLHGDRLPGSVARWSRVLDLPLRPDLAPLRGKDLACWCPLDQPCHADVLLELANR